jgi:hypothetical protein
MIFTHRKIHMESVPWPDAAGTRTILSLSLHLTHTHAEREIFVFLLISTNPKLVNVTDLHPPVNPKQVACFALKCCCAYYYFPCFPNELRVVEESVLQGALLSVPFIAIPPTYVCHGTQSLMFV